MGGGEREPPFTVEASIQSSTLDGHPPVPWSAPMLQAIAAELARPTQVLGAYVETDMHWLRL